MFTVACVNRVADVEMALWKPFIFTRTCAGLTHRGAVDAFDLDERVRTRCVEVGSDLSGTYVSISTTWVRWVEYLIVLDRYRELVWYCSVHGACVWTEERPWSCLDSTKTHAQPHYVMYKQVHLYVLRRHTFKTVSKRPCFQFLLFFFFYTPHWVWQEDSSVTYDSRGSCLDSQIYNMPLENVCAMWSVPQTKPLMDITAVMILPIVKKNPNKQKKPNFPSAFSCESCWLTSTHARCPVKSLWIKKICLQGDNIWEDLSALAQFVESKLQLFPFPLSATNPSLRRETGVSRGAALPVKQQMAQSSQTKRLLEWCVWNDSASHVWHSRSFKIKVTPTRSQWEGNNEVMSKATCVKLKTRDYRVRYNGFRKYQFLILVSTSCITVVPFCITG